MSKLTQIPLQYQYLVIRVMHIYRYSLPKKNIYYEIVTEKKGNNLRLRICLLLSYSIVIYNLWDCLHIVIVLNFEICNNNI